MYIGLHVKYSYSWRIIIQLEFSRRILEKSSNIKFHETPSSGSRVIPRGQINGWTDMTTLNVVFFFRNFANAPTRCVVQK